MGTADIIVVQRVRVNREELITASVLTVLGLGVQ